MAPLPPPPPPPPPLSQAEREILTYSKARFQHYMIREWELKVHTIYVRAAVLKPVAADPAGADAADTDADTDADGRRRSPQFLMLRRAGPHGAYELPGGDVAEDNDSIGEALGRHLCRVTGLKVRHVLGRLGDVTVLSERDDGPSGSTRRASVQVSYVVDVECLPIDGRVVPLDADEHSEAVWVNLDYLKKLPVADDETHSLFEQALEVWGAPAL